jgi:hypothetical protein
MLTAQSLNKEMFQNSANKIGAKFADLASMIKPKQSVVSDNDFVR